MSLPRHLLGAALTAALLLVGACSSSAPDRPKQPSTTSASAPVPTTPGGAGDVQTYLAAVNRLCDALLPKVIAVTHGGSLDIPVKESLAQQPAHAKLLADFDRALARIPVPASAKDKAAALAAYIRFADQLDARRLAAARRGAAAYAAEIKSEASVESSPLVVARNAAGFAPSCDAR